MRQLVDGCPTNQGLERNVQFFRESSQRLAVKEDAGLAYVDAWWQHLARGGQGGNAVRVCVSANQHRRTAGLAVIVQELLVLVSGKSPLMRHPVT